MGQPGSEGSDQLLVVVSLEVSSNGQSELSVTAPPGFGILPFSSFLSKLSLLGFFFLSFFFRELQIHEIMTGFGVRFVSNCQEQVRNLGRVKRYGSTNTRVGDTSIIVKGVDI